MTSMDRCESCRHLSTCPMCSNAVSRFDHIGVRGTTSRLKIPIIDYEISYDSQPSGIWHYSRPCGHRIHPVAASIDVKYNGGPLWKDGYLWQNVYWGTYFAKLTTADWIRRLELVTLHLETDKSYSRGLSQYNVGIGRVIAPITIQQDPPVQISDDQIKKQLTDWIATGAVTDLGTNGAHNIFLPPLTTASLSPTDISCKTYCDYHNTVDGPNGPFYTVEPYPCTQGCNQCTSDPFDTLTQGLSEEIVELKTDMDPGSGWVIGNEELCVPPDTLLLGDNKSILEYAAGDTVIGIGGLQTVKETFVRRYDGELLEIKAVGLLPFRLTPAHSLLVVSGSDRGSRNSKVVHSKMMWKKAEELRPKHSSQDGDYLAMPRLGGSIATTSFPLQHKDARWKLERFELNADTAWLLGLYVAEGFATQNKIRFALDEDEKDLAEKGLTIIQKLGATPWLRRNGLGGQLVIAASKGLAAFFTQHCGKGAANKKIPDFILFHENLGLLKAFLAGYIAGDGCSTLASNKYRVTYYRLIMFNTASKVLAQQIQLAYGRLGSFAWLGKYRSAQNSEILGRKVQLHEAYQGHTYPERQSQRMNKLHGDFFFVPITNVQRTPYKGQVYNIATADNSYLVSNAIFHNCDYCDRNFVCNRISTGEYVNSWYDKVRSTCWKGP